MSHTTFSMIYSTITAVSTACALILMFTVFIVQINEKIRKKREHMSYIFWMSYADFWYSITCFLQSIDEAQQSISCLFIAFGNVFFNVATASWYFVITLRLFMLVHTKDPPRWMEKKYIWHVYVWAVSFTASITAFPSYNKTGLGLCWITENIYQLVILIPLTIYLLFAIVFLCLVLYIGRFVAQKGKRKTLLGGTTVFVGIFLIIWLPACIWQMSNVFLSRDPPTWFQYMTCILAGMSGICNFVVWVCFFQLGKEENQEDIFETNSTTSTTFGIDELSTSTEGKLGWKRRKIKPVWGSKEFSLLTSESRTTPYGSTR